MLKGVIGIYKLTSPDGRVYIGQSINMHVRLIQYRNGLGEGQPRVAESMAKHGWDNHVFEVIETCSVENLNERERFWQEYYDVLGDKGLNSCLVQTATKKMYPSEEVRKKISASNKGLVRSKKARENVSKALKGLKKSSEHVKNMSEALKGVYPEHLRTANASWTEEKRKKLSDSCKGRTPWNVGKSRTASEKAKMSENRKGKVTGEEHHNTKIILNVETGVFYYGAKEAAESTGYLPHSRLKYKFRFSVPCQFYQT